jgi:AraC-like DNA-binding protein
LWKESAGLELEGALIRISRLVQFAKYDSTLGVRERDHLQRFREIRSILYQRSSEHWTAASLAEMAGLGVNRFTVLYKKFFHISPIDDLISIRLEKSKRMLLRGGWSVGEVAERCGFSSMYYFSRIFKSKVGCSPRVFLRQAVSPGG